MTDPPHNASPGPTDLFRGTSEMAALMRAVDWGTTPLGPVETWSASLRTTVNTLLTTRHAMFLWWGPALIQFYNDAYRQSLGPDRHPSALGQQGRDCWAEIWPTIGPEVESIMAGGASTWHEDHLVPITRGDRVHDVYWSYSYSPVQDDDGDVGGVLVTVQETTRRVIGERRVRRLQELGASVQHAGSAEDIGHAVKKALHAAPHDIAFALLYLSDPDAGVMRLRERVGLPAEAPAAPAILSMTADGVWPAARALARTASSMSAEPATPTDTIRCDRWPEPIHEALILPLVASTTEQQPHGVIVVGLNPRIPLDSTYSHFVEQVAREIATALDRVHRLAQERQAALAAAHAERDLLERVFELSPSFLAVLRGPNHIFELANPAYHQLVGHRPILGRALLDALPEVAEQGFRELLDNVYRTGEPFVGNELPVRLQLAAGGPLEARYVNFVYQPMRGAEGIVTGILVSGVDVTALVYAREEAKQAQLDAERLAAERNIERRQLLTALEQSPVAIVIAEPSGRIVFMNRKVHAILGHDRPADSLDAYGDYYHGYHPDGRRLTSDEWPLARALTRGEVIEGNVLNIRREDGEYRTISINAAPAKNAEGHIIAGVVMFQDITAERRLERQLRDAQRMQAVGTLAGGVAHEVNNQMTVVLGFAEYVLRELGHSHRLAADVRLVAQAGKRAARVSQQLLAFTRQQPTQPRSTDLYLLVTALEPVLRQLLGSDKTLAVETEGDLPVFAHVDPSQVEQVLINLIANARDATPTGGRITVRLQHAELTTTDREHPGFTVAPGVYALLAVTDTGRGMDGATLARAFEPFFTTKQVGQGTGLGLSMVYGIVKQHGGYIWLESTPGRGTTAKLLWPALAAEPAEESPGTAARSMRMSGSNALGETSSGTVLVVDDEEGIRRLAARALEGAGFQVLTAEDGAEALRMLDDRGAPLDLVITDIIMPHMNGRQLGDAVAARYARVPILFMSGHAGPDVVMRELVPEGAPFLQKPFAPDTLLEAVQSLIAHGE